MLAATPENMRDARSKGEPTVGSGLIYPFPVEQVFVDDFKIPKHFMRAYGMDVGWNATAATFGAWDKDNDVIYINSEHKQGKAEPIVHAQAIRARGTWMKGTIDPAARGRSQIDGQQLFTMYTTTQEKGGCGLKLIPAPNAVSTGIYTVWERLSTGRLKLFKSCTQLQTEFQRYHRDKNGEIVKTNDHLMDALRYLIMADKNIWSFPAAERTGNVTNMQDYMKACI